MSILSSFQNLLLGLLVVRNPGNVLSFYPGIWIRNSSHFLLPWSSYSQFNLISRIRNITSPLKLHVCLNSIKSVINYSTLSSFLRVLLWNVALSIASFVSRSSIFLFVLHILINDFFSLSHKLMYKSSTSVTEVIQRKSACSYLCLPNSGFNIFFCFSLLLWRAVVAQVFLLLLFLLTTCLACILYFVVTSASLLGLYVCHGFLVSELGS